LARDEAVVDEPAPRRGRVRRVAAVVTTALATGLMLFALLLPNDLSRLTLLGFVRLPVEALLGIAVVLVLPARLRRAAAVLIGVSLGVLTIIKVLDIGFYETLDRPFDLVFDWGLLPPAVTALGQSAGEAGAIGAVVLAIAVAVGLLVFMALSAMRLTHVVVRHRTVAARAVAALAVVAVACAAFGVRIVPDVPAASLAFGDLRQIRAGLLDQRAFEREKTVDAFRDTPADNLLTGLRGKDVMLTFIESYGRVAVDSSRYAGVRAVLDAGDRRLRAAGFGVRSAYLTSSTAGGGSWLGHSTLLSGLWVNNQARYHSLMKSDRLTLNKAFDKAGWRTIGLMPGLTEAWPEGAFYGYDKVYGRSDVGYNGPLFTLATMPDQFTLEAFQRLERKPNHSPVMAEIALTSSHWPWAPIPEPVDWNALGDGTIFGPMAYPGNSPQIVRRSAERVRVDYGRTIEYSLSMLVAYLEKYGDDNLVLVFLGDHQPTKAITGKGASREVPITIVAHDQAVLDRIAGWGWQSTLKPDRRAPVWRMDKFRDRFMTAFGPRPSGARPPAPTGK
jgi:sulfatase-like protein